MIFELPTSVEIAGEEFEIRSDFRVILNIIEALNDADLNDSEKAEALLILFYPDYEKIKNYQEAITKCLEFIDMGESKPQKKSARLMDWEHDWNYIISPVNRVLGYEARAVEYLHWWTFLGAYMEIGECVLSQIINIRDKQAKGKKLEKHEKEWARKNANLIYLPQKYSQAEQELMKQMGV